MCPTVCVWESEYNFQELVILVNFKDFFRLFSESNYFEKIS